MNGGVVSPELSPRESYKEMKAFKLILPAALVAIALLGGSITTLGQTKVVKTTARAGDTSVSLFPLDDVRPGMKGVARSVFSGTASQEYSVEILGVLPGFTGPRQSTIIAKLSGPGVDKTGVFAGMSGSPVFINDRLVGAILHL